MVRKTTRAAAIKVQEKTRQESPRRGRRRRSSSKSADSEEDLPAKLQKTSNQSEKGSSENESDTESRKPLKKRTRSKAANDIKESTSESVDSVIGGESKNNQEYVNEDESKGKSNSVNNSNNDNVSADAENDNVQVTGESPNYNKSPNDLVQSNNGMETSAIDVNISMSLVAEMTCENQSMEQGDAVNVGDNNSLNVTDESKDKNIPTPEKNDDQPPELHCDEEGNKQSAPESSKKIKLNRLRRDKNVSAENKNEEKESKRKITLKRPESKPSSQENEKQHEENQDSANQPENNDWNSSYEANTDKGKETKELNDTTQEKPARKKITLKRSTFEDCSTAEKINLNRSFSLQERDERKKSTDNIVIKERPRRHSEKSASESEEKPQKPKKPTKVVKLIRKLPQESCEPLLSGEEGVKKYKWTPSESYQYEIEAYSFEYLQEICPSIEFLNEEDIKLEDTPPAEKKTPEKKRMSFKELEDEEMENIEAELNAEPEDIEIKENIIAMNRKISIVDDTASKLRPPPSPAKNPVSQVLFITNLVRPFTVRQLKELLERTGRIKEDGFWTDKIKSKCYVCYETEEEAESTRNALHGVHWPIGNGKKLVIDYSTVEDMKNARNPTLDVPRREKSPEKENVRPVVIEDTHKEKDRREGRTGKRDWDVDKKDDHHHRRSSRSRSRERRDRKHSQRSYTPEARKKHKREEPIPQKAMDDLFLKTKATPSIYWQPLSPEEIARKEKQRQMRLEENRRRYEELNRSSGRGRDRGGRDRNFRRR